MKPEWRGPKRSAAPYAPCLPGTAVPRAARRRARAANPRGPRRRSPGRPGGPALRGAPVRPGNPGARPPPRLSPMPAATRKPAPARSPPSACGRRNAERPGRPRADPAAACRAPAGAASRAAAARAHAPAAPPDPRPLHGPGRQRCARHILPFTTPAAWATSPPTGSTMCGRGGIGRRAALRSLWGNTRGSSSLLDRTKIFPYPVDLINFQSPRPCAPRHTPLAR